ncbi:uncharacterized protein LOC126745923 [Anthonomus grandis grandis]|uniref:uncharacterized protein LOC126745923 n=1 Tax=Anthonomus grandis grandis TaxID=2921223 RepID=UPI00216614B6|nr:uncharacterized protein LOC126745923 [Anthonomus grandis grandis]
MLGIWFVVEKINHTYIDNYIGRNPIMSTCPIVHLSSYQPYSNEDLDEEKYRRKRPKYPSNELNRFQENDNGLYKDPYQVHYVPDYTYPDFTQYLRMYYETEENSVEAFYRYEIIDPGYWISPKLDGIRSPKLFAGNVQILKAVGSHMVLTFCDGRHRYLYTLILARQRFLSRKELIGIHNLISRQKLSTFSVEKFCSSSNSLFASYRIYIIIFGFFVNKLSY